MALNLFIMQSMGTFKVVSEAGNHFTFMPNESFAEFEKTYVE